MNKKELQARMAPEAPLPPAVAKKQRENLAVVSPLQARFNQIVVKDEASCQEMDALMGDVVQARRGWGSIWAVIHKESIEPIMKGINALHGVNRTIDGPLGLLEGAAKAAIKTFRVADQRRIEAARVESDRLNREAEELQARIDSARTLTQRAKLVEKMEVIETKAVKALDAQVPVQTENSGNRTKPAWRLIGSELESDDVPPSFMAMLEGIILGHIPPQAVCLDTKFINEVFRGEPKVVESWPGFEVFDDIQIVRK